MKNIMWCCNSYIVCLTWQFENLGMDFLGLGSGYAMSAGVF